MTALLLAALGNLRSDFLSRERAHAGDRHSPGAGSATGDDPADGSASGLGLAMAGAGLGLLGSVIVSHLMAGQGCSMA